IWDEKKFTIVFHGNYLKFSQNTDLKEYLLSTSPLELVEASPYDKIWGIGLKADDPRARYKNTWQGENLLGQALVQVRTSIQREQVSEK
ncbi:NADAR family protein, partial [Lactiplantibacillus plantarum]|uniref:NADAR family protein n=1 Tax=Lactiplantibacillus plantarum TaxID=1590 RepID=UPI003C27BD0B